MGAFGFQSGGDRVSIDPNYITDKDGKQFALKDYLGAVPALGMTTIDSVAFGFQNQTVYTAAFHNETVDLFTPQLTFNRQNLDRQRQSLPGSNRRPEEGRFLLRGRFFGDVGADLFRRRVADKHQSGFFPNSGRADRPHRLEIDATIDGDRTGL